MKTEQERNAALAEALHRHKIGCVNVDPFLHEKQHEEDAAAILAALREKGWDIHYDEDWNARAMKDAAEIDRLQEQIARQAAADGTLAIAFDAVRAEATINRLKKALLDIATATGADTSEIDNPDQITHPPIEEYALACVNEMRQAFEEGEGEDAAEILRLREAVQTEWYNGGVDEKARNRILQDND